MSSPNVAGQNPPIVVCPNGTGACRTITEAVARALPNDTILLRPGTYREDVVLAKPVKVRGVGALSEVVLVNKDWYPLKTLANALIENVSIRTDSAYALLVHGGRLSLAGCEIVGLVGVAGQGSRLDLNGCVLREKGIELSDGAVLTMSDSQLLDYDIEGVLITGGSHAHLSRSKVLRGGKCGILVAQSRVTLEDCDVGGARYGLIAFGSRPALRSCNIRGSTEAYLLQEDSTMDADAQCVFSVSEE